MKIIYLSGIDGCGKTTQAKLLVKYLNDKGVYADYLWFRWEPSLRKLINFFRNRKVKTALYKHPHQDRIVAENTEQDDWHRTKRVILSNSIIRKIWLFYACADYFILYKKRFENIASHIVIVDRYIDDFIIDQAVNLNISPDNMHLLKKNFFLNKFRYPDLYIIIDIPATEGYRRKKDGTSLTYLETREKYYQAMNGHDTLHLDGLDSIDKLAFQISEWISNKLGVGKI